MLPGKFDKLQRPERWNVDPRPAQTFSGRRSGDSNCSQLVADVRYFNVIHDDVLVKHGQDFPDLRLIGVNQQGFAPVVSVQIPQDVSLGIEQKCIHTAARRQIPNVVGNHAIQPAHSITAPERNLRPGAEIVEPAARNKRLEFSTRVAKISRRDTDGLCFPCPQAVLLCHQAHALYIFDYSGGITFQRAPPSVKADWRC